MEVLSPVGTGEMLVAAVRSGADAVYLGGAAFNARRGAENFDNEQLKNAVEFCHKRGVKVYLTLNIVVRDDEIESAVSLAKVAESLCVDGVIVQDLGLAQILKTATPNLALHASTQMSVQSESALPFLKEMGFKRVVVAREMSKSQMEKICKKAKELNLEIEVFVHGALCMCVSGQCMLSSMLGTRSGNRGLCAGTCRLPFTAKNNSDDYALSLKDLSLLEHIEELKNMGVASLKIEGRMKRPEYVAVATATVKGAVNNEDIRENAQLLKDVFTRSGFTDGYFADNIGADMFGIRTKDDVLKTKDALPKIHNLYRNERQSVKIDITFSAKENAPLSLTVCDGENTVTVLGDAPEKAQNRPTEKETVETALKKLGGTPFVCEKCSIQLENGLFLSAAALNSLRRDAVEKLLNRRFKTRPLSQTQIPLKPQGESHKNSGFVLSVQSEKQLENVDDFSNIYAVVVPAHKPFKVSGVKCFIELSNGIKTEETVLKQIKKAKELGLDGAVVHNLAHLALCKAENFEVFGGMGLNVYNSFTAEKLKENGVNLLTVSPEMQIKNAANVRTTAKTALFAYGRMPLMTTRNCPVKAQIGCKKCGGNGALTDRTGKVFPVTCDGEFSRLLNCVPVYMGDKKDDLKNFDYLYLSFTTETADEVLEILENYKNGIPDTKDFTRGLYYRNVE